MSEWLDLELAHQLTPVTAPDGLWTRVQAGRRPPTPAARLWRLRLPALAAMAFLIAASALWSGRRSAGIESLAARELLSSEPLMLRSADATEIRSWLHDRAEIDLPVPAHAQVRLKGARVIRDHGAVFGEVAYDVPGGNALLLVARSSGDLRAPSRHGGRSWQKDRQVYAIACSIPNQPEAGCVFCHASL